MSLDVAALFAAEHGRLCRYFRRRIGRRDPSLAEDLASAVFLRAWEKRGLYQVRPGVPAAAWLMRLAHTILMDYFRAERPTVSVEMRATLGYEVATHDTRDPASVLDLRAALAALRPKQRAVIVGYYYDGKKQRELVDIATLEGVKKLQQRALVNLRRALGAA